MPNDQHAEAPAAIRVIEMVGVSDVSWSHAAEQAVERASETIRHVTGVDVLHATGVVRKGRIVEYHTNVKIAFAVDRDDLHFAPGEK